MNYDIKAIQRALPDLPKDRPFIVALDGGSGCGKSTLSKEWAAADSRVTIAMLDDFYRPVGDEALKKMSPRDEHENAFDTSRIIQQLLKPLHSGENTKYQQLNWVKSKRGDDVTQRIQETLSNGF